MKASRVVLLVVGTAVVASALTGVIVWQLTSNEPVSPVPAPEEQGLVIHATIYYSDFCPSQFRSIEVRAPTDGIHTGELLGVGESGTTEFNEFGCVLEVDVPVLSSAFYIVTDAERQYQWGPFSKSELERNAGLLTLETAQSPIGD